MAGPASATPVDSRPGEGARVAATVGRVTTSAPLNGRVALVAGATRAAGRGIAVALGEAGATVYCTGRTTARARSEMDRPEDAESATGGGDDGAGAEAGADEQGLNAFFRCESVKQ